MLLLFIMGLLLGGLSVVFVMQNTAVITITLFAWQLTGSLAVVLIMAILAGILITLLMILPESIDTFLKYRKFEKEIKRLEEDLRRQKELTVFAKKTNPTSDDLARIEHGAIEKVVH